MRDLGPRRAISGDLALSRAISGPRRAISGDLGASLARRHTCSKKGRARLEPRGSRARSVLAAYRPRRLRRRRRCRAIREWMTPPNEHTREGGRDDRGVPYHAESTLSSAQVLKWMCFSGIGFALAEVVGLCNSRFTCVISSLKTRRPHHGDTLEIRGDRGGRYGRG